jgi:hypothetical protein
MSGTTRQHGPAAGPVTGLDHVQIAAPAGCEDEARGFFSGILGTTRSATGWSSWR